MAKDVSANTDKTDSKTGKKGTADADKAGSTTGKKGTAGADKPGSTTGNKGTAGADKTGPTTGKNVVADIDESSLSFKPVPSDRFVYSNYYVPLRITFDDDRTPVLPFYVKQALIEADASGEVSGGQLQEILFDRLKLDDIWSRNDLDRARLLWDQSREGIESHTPSDESSTAPRPTVLLDQDVEFIAGLLEPDIGFVFVDRTRITPVGFALGEHIYALALAPGEEVVLEQKTYTKRQVTFEEQTEEEKQFELELASTYSTELQEGLERHRSVTDTLGLNASHTGEYKGPEFFWGQINGSHTIAYTRNVIEASQQINRRSVKDSQTASGKVASRYRTQHKTTFRLVTERGVETTSKRTIRNPNATTPVTLHYFKVLQRLQMKHERYGVRLCWTASVEDPAAAFVEKLRAAHKAVIEDAMRKLPAKPLEPLAPPKKDDTAKTTRVNKAASSGFTEATGWNLAGGISHDHPVDISVPQGYLWDGVHNDDQISIESKRPHDKINRRFVGRPWEDGNVVHTLIHIGAPEWVNGPGIKFQVMLNVYQEVTVHEKAADDTKYADDLALYRTRLKEWQDLYDTTLAAAQKEADARVQNLLAQLSPVNELIAQLIDRKFPHAVRDEMWEIDYWQRLFDWERATFVAYPNWWSGNALRDPLLDPSAFINASWAKLYLPVRVGMERAALRWIFGKAVNVLLSADIESRFDKVVADLEAYRAKELGASGELEELKETCQAVKELHKCLARWEEVMPTDGTHVEVVQGTTNAADAITMKQLSDAADLRAAILAKEKKASEIADKAKSLMTKSANINVHIGNRVDSE